MKDTTAALRVAAVLLAATAVLAFAPALLPGPAAAEDSDDDPEARRAVGAALVAAGTVAFAGTQVLTTWAAGGAGSRVVDVVQRTGGQRYARTRPTTGGSRSEGGKGGDGSSATTSRDVALLLPLSAPALQTLRDTCGFASLGRSFVAGRVASVVEARRGSLAVARLWVDDATGLLLRLEVLDRRGGLTRMAVFLDITVPEGSPSASPSSPTSTRSTSAVSSSGQWSLALREEVRDAGYPCPDALPFGLRLVDVRWSRSGDRKAVHLTYSDGLSGMSVFVQPGALDQSGLTEESAGAWLPRRWNGVDVLLAAQPPARAVWESGGHVVTLVTDPSLEPVRDIVEAFPHIEADDGLRADLAGLAQDLMSLLPGR